MSRHPFVIGSPVVVFNPPAFAVRFNGVVTDIAETNDDFVYIVTQADGTETGHYSRYVYLAAVEKTE